MPEPTRTYRDDRDSPPTARTAPPSARWRRARPRAASAVAYALLAALILAAIIRGIT